MTYAGCFGLVWTWREYDERRYVGGVQGGEVVAGVCCSRYVVGVVVVGLVVVDAVIGGELLPMMTVAEMMYSMCVSVVVAVVVAVGLGGDEDMSTCHLVKECSAAGCGADYCEDGWHDHTDYMRDHHHHQQQ